MPSLVVVILCSKQAPCFSLDKGHSPSESTTVLRNYTFESCGKLPMLEGWDRSPPDESQRWKSALAPQGQQPSPCKPHWEPCTTCTLPVWVCQQQLSDSKHHITAWHTYFPWISQSVPWWLFEKAVQSLAEHRNSCTLSVSCAGWTTANPKSSRCTWRSDNSLAHGKGPATRPAQFSLFNLLSTFSGLTAWVAEPPSAI